MMSTGEGRYCQCHARREEGRTGTYHVSGPYDDNSTVSYFPGNQNDQPCRSAIIFLRRTVPAYPLPLCNQDTGISFQSGRGKHMWWTDPSLRSAARRVMYCSHRLPTTLPHEKQRTGMICGRGNQAIAAGIVRGRAYHFEVLCLWVEVQSRGGEVRRGRDGGMVVNSHEALGRCKMIEAIFVIR
jgi:hypothetical protein